MIRIPIKDKNTTIFLEGYLDIVKPPIRESISKDRDQNILDTAISIVVFSHGSGSSKDSTRNRTISSIFHKMGLSTLLIDLLTNEEKETDFRTEKIRNKIPGLFLNKFNIGLLKERLMIITKWLADDKSLSLKNIGYLGSSTGATAAFLATLELSNSSNSTVNNYNISTIVSRGGRTDLINDANAYKQIKVPTLFIVGSEDKGIIKINKKTRQKFNPHVCTRIEVIPGASHLFDEEGKIEVVAEIAGNWFLKFL